MVTCRPLDIPHRHAFEARLGAMLSMACKATPSPTSTRTLQRPLPSYISGGVFIHFSRGGFLGTKWVFFWYLPEERVQPNGRVTARVPRAAAKLVETVTGTGRGTECPSPGLPGSSR